MKVVVSIYLDTRRKLKTGLFPVKLRVYQNRITKLYGLPNDDLSLSIKNFDASYNSQKPKTEELYEYKRRLIRHEQLAQDIISGLKKFSFDEFEKQLLGSRQADCDLCSLIASKIEELESNNQFGTAISYDVTRKSFLKFMADIYPKKKIIHLGDIDILFLNAYKNWMTKQGRSNTTIGIYLRNIRHIFNSAIQKGITGTDSYPFGRGKTKIPAGRALKKALSKEELNKLFHFSVENNSQQQIARDFWFLSYSCNGMNFRDILGLRQKDVKDGRITFIRAKTSNTTIENQQPIQVILTDFGKKIVNKYMVRALDPDSYIFTYLNNKMSASQKRIATQKFTRFVNQHIKKLASKAGIETPISVNSARHSFTTVAINNGATMEYIQESLGHQNLRTTMNYWKGFEDSTKAEVTERLMYF